MTSLTEKIAAGKSEIQTLRAQLGQYDQARNELNIKIIKWEGVVEFLQNEEKEQASTQESFEGGEEQAPQ